MPTYPTRCCAVLLTAGILLVTCGCITGREAGKRQNDAESYTYKPQPDLNTPPERLITDYTGIQQDDTIAWLWIKPGYRIDSLRRANLYPLKNLSRVEYPWAQQQVTAVLEEIFPPGSSQPSPQHHLGVMAAIVDLIPEQGLLDHFFPDFDDYPYIEIEIVVFEEDSKKIVGKFCHYGKDEDFFEALASLLEDIRTVFGLTQRSS